MTKALLTSSFNDLEFEPVQHKYTLQGQDMPPVSKVIDRYKEEFDTEGIAKRYAERHGLSVEDVKRSWQNAGDVGCDFGHSVHDFGEDYFDGKRTIPTNQHEVALVRFWKDMPNFIMPVASETRVYSKRYRYAGTFDLLLHNSRDKGYIIVDYKTNKDLFKNYRGKLMLSPFEFMLDSPFNHYQIQLSLYQIPLEEVGINIIQRIVVWLLPDGNYRRYDTENYTSILKQSLTSN